MSWNEVIVVDVAHVDKFYDELEQVALARKSFLPHRG